MKGLKYTIKDKLQNVIIVNENNYEERLLKFNSYYHQPHILK